MIKNKSGKKDLHPVYGYDPGKVPDVKCLMCNAPIGTEQWVEVTSLARFGTMLFRHKRCEEAADAKT